MFGVLSACTACSSGAFSSSQEYPQLMRLILLVPCESSQAGVVQLFFITVLISSENRNKGAPYNINNQK